MKKIVIAGSRTITDSIFIIKELDNVLRDDFFHGEEIVIISGTARGVDTVGEEYARLRGLEVERYPAEWDNLDVKPCYVKINQYGKKYNAMAGKNRNKLMAEKCDAAVIFWDGYSSGTKHMIETIRKLNKKLYLYVGKNRMI